MEEICFSSANYHIKVKRELKYHYFFVYSPEKNPYVQKCNGNIVEIYHGKMNEDNDDTNYEPYFTEIVFGKYGEKFKFYNWKKKDYFYFIKWLKFCDLDRQHKFKYIELGNIDKSHYYFKIIKTKKKIHIYKHVIDSDPEMRVFEYNDVIFNEVYKNMTGDYTVYFYSRNGSKFQYHAFLEKDAQKLEKFLNS